MTKHEYHTGEVYDYNSINNSREGKVMIAKETFSAVVDEGVII